MEDHDEHDSHSPEMFKRKFWIVLLLTIPTLLFSNTIQSWLGFELAFSGSQHIPTILGLIIFFYGGMVFLKGARDELSHKQPGMMTLISLAITVAFVYSLAVSLGLVDGMDFWWELATLVTIMLLGHWMEMASVHNAQGALKELAKLLPDEAELVTGADIKKVRLDSLKTGDKVLVRPGASVPADGQVIKGESSINESMITGESRPVKKSKGAEVIAGTINQSGALTVKITKVGEDTALSGIMKLVAQAQASRSRAQTLADRAAFYLTIIAIVAAIATLIGWSFADRSTQFVLERVVTVLVIACPHALGLAIPLVTAISTTLGAQNGLLVRKRRALESARNIDIVLFDKTGTLTKGEQGVVKVVAENDEKTLLSQAAAVEAESEHPIAQAIVRHAREKKVYQSNASGFSSMAGRGVSGQIKGKKIYVGSHTLANDLKATIPSKIKQAVTQAEGEGKSVVFVIEGRKVTGAIMLADVIREESKQTITKLRQMGKEVGLITGDGDAIAQWVGRELGIKEIFAEVLPKNKADSVKKLQNEGKRVAFVGDGVNDAPALVQADAGIAIGAGTDVAIESADIVLVSSDPSAVPKIIRLSKATYRKMLQNLAWATGYNAVAIPLAAGVLAGVGFVLSPAVGAILMSLSTVIVAINAQLLRKLVL